MMTRRTEFCKLPYAPTFLHGPSTVQAMSRPQSLTAAQQQLSIRVFAILADTYKRQQDLADALDTTQPTIGRAAKGVTSLSLLTRAAVLARIPVSEMEAAGIPVAHIPCTWEDALRVLAVEEGFSERTFEHFLRVRGNLGMQSMTMLEALKMMRVIQETGRTIEVEASAATVDELFDEKPKKRR